MKIDIDIKPTWKEVRTFAFGTVVVRYDATGVWMICWPEDCAAANYSTLVNLQNGMVHRVSPKSKVRSIDYQFIVHEDVSNLL